MTYHFKMFVTIPLLNIENKLKYAIFITEI